VGFASRISKIRVPAAMDCWMVLLTLLIFLRGS